MHYLPLVNGETLRPIKGACLLVSSRCLGVLAGRSVYWLSKKFRKWSWRLSLWWWWWWWFSKSPEMQWRRVVSRIALWNAKVTLLTRCLGICLGSCTGDGAQKPLDHHDLCKLGCTLDRCLKYSNGTSSSFYPFSMSFLIEFSPTHNIYIYASVLIFAGR